MFSLLAAKERTRENCRYFRGAGHGQGDPSPWTPNYVGRGRAGLKNRQDTFFDAPPTRSRLTAPPITFADVGVFTRLFLFYGWFVGRGLDPSLLLCGCRPFPRRGGVTSPYGAIKIHRAVGAGHCPARGFAAISILRVLCRDGIYAARRSHPGKST